MSATQKFLLFFFYFEEILSKVDFYFLSELLIDLIIHMSAERNGETVTCSDHQMKKFDAYKLTELKVKGILVS